LFQKRTRSIGVALCSTSELFVKEAQENEERDSTEKKNYRGWSWNLMDIFFILLCLLCHYIIWDYMYHKVDTKLTYKQAKYTYVFLSYDQNIQECENIKEVNLFFENVQESDSQRSYVLD
jgi:hypothetical protein